MNEYEERNVEVGRLGFTSYTQYLSSDLWDLIRRAVLYRDQCECRRVGCRVKGVKQAHHLAYSRATLLGINPASIVTLCYKCHEECEHDGKLKLPFEKVVSKTLRRVIAGGEMIRGKSNPKIGQWYRNQFQTNRETAQRIFDSLPTTWQQVIRLDLAKGKLPEVYISYLDLDESLQRRGEPSPYVTARELKKQQEERRAKEKKEVDRFAKLLKRREEQ